MSKNNTVDQEEVEHFSKMKWWAENSELRFLHSMNRLRVPFVQESLISNNLIKDDRIDSLKPLLGLKIADVGCGGGFLSEPLAQLGAQVTGIDACATALSEARQHAALDSSIGSRLNYIDTMIEEHAKTHKGYYDVVVSSEVIEHVTNKTTFLKACCEVLKPGGSLIMTTISQSFISWFLTIFLGENVMGIAPRGTHQYEKLITSHALRERLKENNLTTLEVRQMVYNPIKGQWEWTSLIEAYYAIHAIKDQ